ncbi:MAG: undecaprenyldiphospho-muramoylpentapeptide beta-N-acetylglucosaminyltransferase [Gammaproteobacteria bacterium]|nr:undecaprenyldiphospho-muramoylpentapeptide beta-N-acetylglucosaminyltransferase [Gammaproteobacteria bacterium]
MTASIMIASGGTGGHVFPALAVADDLRTSGINVTWLGTQHGMENRVVPEAGIPLDQISASGFRGKGVLGKFKAIQGLLLSCIQAFRILRHRKPGLLLGMGGFVTVPAGVMAYLLRIPVVIHEQNRVVGTANQLLKLIARRIMQAFPDAFPDKYHAIFTGNPLRKTFIDKGIDKSPTESSEGRTHLLIVGGSQGAKTLNQVIPGAIAECALTDIDIIHQCGEQWLDETQNSYQQHNIDAQIVTFFDNMAEQYQWADIVICRAGAMTISELCAVGLPSILIPYPHAIDDHQTRNADYLVDAGGAILIADKDLTEQSLAQQFSALLANPSRLATMRNAVKSLAKPDATKHVADICKEEMQA